MSSGRLGQPLGIVSTPNNSLQQTTASILDAWHQASAAASFIR